MIEQDRASDRLEALAEVARGAPTSPTRAELEHGLSALKTRLRDRRRRAPARVALMAAVAAVALCVVALVVPALKQPDPAVGPVNVQRIEGGKLLEGGYLAEQGNSGVELHFNEGSHFTLSPGARGRLRSLSAGGTRFALDHGTAVFRITPNAKREWWVEAGPFSISVRGTDFTVAWEPTSERFEVQLRKGRVAVSGPVVGDELVLRPGQKLAVNLPKGETVISEVPSRPVAPVVASSASASPSSSPSDAEPAQSAKPAAGVALGPSSAAAAGERGFRAALANGEWDRILAEVEREGVEASLRRLSSDDLFAVADAARYRRRTDVARAALLAQRARFPNSPRSIDALFLLGRTEELGQGGRRAALARYDEYLSRAPSGTYAAEALGRKMILIKELEGPESARQTASEYLKRFPRGSYAEVARTLQRLPSP